MAYRQEMPARKVATSKKAEGMPVAERWHVQQRLVPASRPPWLQAGAVCGVRRMVNARRRHGQMPVHSLY